MASINPWVFSATLNYETGLVEALAALDEADEDGLIEARERIVDALRLFEMMTNEDRQDALMCLLRRGRISEKNWDRIEAVMRSLACREGAHG